MSARGQSVFVSVFVDLPTGTT